MFRILEFELVHWDFWRRFSLPLDANIVTIVGPNGSGKTTLLDALRTLLALPCSPKREYKRYVRKSGEDFCWLRGVIDNRRSDTGRHPFFPLVAEQVTVACRIDKKGGDWSRQYLIADGNLALEPLAQRSDWIGVQDYRRRLDSAGLTPAIAQVLSLEQGATDKLCEYSPKALLDLVFQVFGDKQVMERYQEAKLHQQETERDLREIDRQLATLALDIERLTSRVNNLREWQNLTKERAMLAAEVLPRVQYAQLAESIRMARVQLIGAKREWTAKRAERDLLQAQAPQLEQDLSAARAAYAGAQHTERSAIQAFTQAREDVARIEQLLRERDRLLRLAQAQTAQDPAALTRRLGEDELARSELDVRLRHLEREREQAHAMLKALTSGQRADPQDVQALRAALDEAGIDHDLLPEVVEIADPAWQNAVEALLAPYRHIILLRHDRDRARAWTLGEQVRYRHFIVPDRQSAPAATPNSALEVVRFKTTVPSWLTHLLDRTQRVEDAEDGARQPQQQDWVTRQGYLRERRGGRHAGVKAVEYAFGRARIAAVETRLRQLTEEIERTRVERQPLQERIDRARALLSGIDAAKDLAARADEFAQAEHALQQAKESVRLQGATLAEMQHEREAAGLAQHRAERALEQAQARLAALAREIKEREQEPAHAEQRRRILLLRHERAKLPAEWRSRGANQALIEKYESAPAVQREIERIERRLADEEWVTDESVVTHRDKLREDFAVQGQEQERRRAENARAATLTESARQAYVDVLRATLRRYAKNLRALGELSNIEVAVEPPHLAGDDVTLAQAGLEVRFDFDRKGFIGLNDGDASGGQQVMKSLILLIGLMMEESRPGGFVFIDEPFAHLDIFNIDRVAAFLRATRAQYLITTPITHNVNVFDPALLTLVTFKKRPGEHWAEPIARLVREAGHA